MGNVINIFGRLHAQTEEGILTTTDEILDKNLNKTQEEINQSIPDVSNFITKSVDDLVNYYLKDDTYTKQEVQALIGTISQFHYEIYATLPATGANNVLYLIGPIGSGNDKYEEYVYANDIWTKIGDTSIDLSGYVTTQALNAALANYITSSDLSTALVAKQDVIDDLAQIRSNAATGAKALQDINETLVNQEFVYRKCPSTIKPNSIILNRIYGKTLAWNQLADDLDVSSFWVYNYGTISNGQYNSGSVSSGAYGLRSSSYTVFGHIYIIEFEIINDAIVTVRVGDANEDVITTNTNWLHQLFRVAPSASDVRPLIGFNCDVVGASYQIRNICLYDLTLIFGEGHEPSTVEEFEALFPGYHEYSAGKLISNDAKAIETVGFNLWDESKRVDGRYISYLDGNEVSNADYSHTGYIRVLPNTQYYFRQGIDAAEYGAYYDADKKFISGVSDFKELFTTPAQAAYVRITLQVSDSSDNICINLSDPSKNGTYEPYRKSTMQLGLDNIKVKSHNIWDEEWVNGYYNSDGSVYDDDTSALRSKNLITVSPNTTYYWHKPYGGRIYYFGADGSFIARTDTLDNDSTFTTPVNCYKIGFNIFSGSSGYTYNNDICINVSSSFNGQYEPHGDITITGGLKSAGTVKDEIVGNKYIKRVGRVNLGEASWQYDTTYLGFFAYAPGSKDFFKAVCSKYPFVGSYSIVNDKQCGYLYNVFVFVKDSTYGTDAEAFASAMEGVYVDYELATPIEYELVEPIIPITSSGTTERRISPNADGLSAPFCGDIIYSLAHTFAKDVYDNIPVEFGKGGYSIQQKHTNCNAKGNSSFAEGNNTVTENESEHAEGRFNKSNKASGTFGNAGNTQHSVGIGTYDNRKNAHEIMQNGDHYVYGIGGYDGTNPSSANTLQEVVNSKISNSVNNLINYYLKSETYTKQEVQNLIGTISRFRYEIYSSIGDITNPESNILYLVGPIGTGADKYEEYVYSNNTLVKIGDTSIDLSGYALTNDIPIEYGFGSDAVQQKGTNCNAEGDNSFAEGYGTHTIGINSHAEGEHTITNNLGEHAEGRFNKSNQDTLHSVGFGYINASQHRVILRNAHEIMNDGKHYVFGVGGYDGTNAGTQGVKTLQEVVNEGGGSSIVEITYSELKNLRNNSQLAPGKQYRITDYQCTTVQENTQSAGHQFDIIVVADKVNKLNENARACLHDGDTYFTNCKLEAWELKYSLDNDITKFIWADDTNGKGVIYWMKDEWNNECPYDFKNIQFKRWAITSVTNKTNNITEQAYNSLTTFKYGYYGEDYVDEPGFKNYRYFSNSPSDIETIDLQLSVDNENFKWYYTFGETDYTITGTQVYNNIIKPYIITELVDRPYPIIQEIESRYRLNNIVFINKLVNYTFYCCNNKIGNNCRLITFGNNCRNNIFKEGCTVNLFGDNCSFNKFENNYIYNVIADNCSYNIFGNKCNNNVIGENCNNNVFHNNCTNITFGTNCNNNIIENDCDKINFLANYSYNIRVENNNINIKLNILSYSTSDANKLQNIIIYAVSNINPNTTKVISHSSVNDSYPTIYKSRDVREINF